MELKQVALSWSPSVIKDLQYFAMYGHPFEVCGVIHEHGIIHQYQNTFCGDKRLGFDMEMDPNDKSIRAIWHSHPKGLAHPSTDDLPCMRLLYEHGFGYPWVIVTPKYVTQWICLITQENSPA